MGAVLARAGTSTRKLSALALVVLLLVLSGCGGGEEGAADGAPDETAGDATDVAEGEGDGEGVEGAGEPGPPEENPCGPDAPAELEGPSGEPPADGAETVEVTAVDYAFEGVEETYAPGSYAIEMHNDGTELHEVVVFAVDDDRPVEELLQLPDEEIEEIVEDLGGAAACPGESAEPFGVELTAGRHVMICFVPVGFTPEADPAEVDGPPHAAQGMISEIMVEG